MIPMIPPEEEPTPTPVDRQWPHRYHLPAATPSLAVRPALGDGISDALSREFLRDSTDGRRPAHPHVRGYPTRRSVTVPGSARAMLHSSIPRSPGRYTDRASAGPNSSWADTTGLEFRCGSVAPP